MSVTLVDLLTKASKRLGDRIALTFDPDGQTVTFAELESVTNRIAWALQAAGVLSGDRIGIMLRNTPHWPLTWIAGLKLGAVVVPLNVFYQVSDARYLIEHAGVSLIVCEPDLEPVVTKASAGLVSIGHILTAENLMQRSKLHSDNGLQTLIQDQSLANIQYTSGTTGKPKGCQLTHAWFFEFSQRFSRAYESLSETDTILTTAPFYYVDPQWNLALSLSLGCHLVVADRFHPSTFWKTVRRHRVTWFYCLGVMPKLLLKADRSTDEPIHHLRFVSCSGIPAVDHEAIEKRWGVKWYETYGMTETGLDLGVSFDEHDSLVGTGCIGRPLPTREAMVVDCDDNAVQPNIVGELVLRGPGMMQGYYRNSDATKAVFRNGWMHTGDQVRQDREGRFYFVGRLKDMIRRSGENIAAQEVEEIIGQHPAVRLVACVAVSDEIRGEEIKAYVVLQVGVVESSELLERLVKFCKARIAYFKVPRYWVFRKDFPRTPSEKIMKNLLVGDEIDRNSQTYDTSDKKWH